MGRDYGSEAPVFTPEYKEQMARQVVEESRPIAMTARDSERAVVAELGE
jgi:hypothetical protein